MRHKTSLILPLFLLSCSQAPFVENPHEKVLVAPALSTPGGTYQSHFKLELSVEPQIVGFFTVDGSDPRESSSRTQFEKGSVFEVNKDVTVKTVAFAAGRYSAVNETKYQITGYSFFVAGHAYGTPDMGIQVSQFGLHAPFYAYWSELRDKPNLSWGVLTGDVVWKPSPEKWDEVDSQLRELGLPIYFAVGNHDMQDRELFEKRYGPTYWYRRYGNDLMIVLDPNLASWNISDEQLIMVREALATNPTPDNIFVFSHQLIWWDQTGPFSTYLPNSMEGIDKDHDLNFDTSIVPLFDSTNASVTVFAGDVGAWPTNSKVFDSQYSDKIRLVSSGMGGRVSDAFTLVNVAGTGEITVSFIPLQELVAYWR